MIHNRPSWTVADRICRPRNGDTGSARQVAPSADDQTSVVKLLTPINHIRLFSTRAFAYEAGSKAATCVSGVQVMPSEHSHGVPGGGVGGMGGMDM